jgi:hypothetical protein
MFGCMLQSYVINMVDFLNSRYFYMGSNSCDNSFIFKFLINLLYNLMLHIELTYSYKPYR